MAQRVLHGADSWRYAFESGQVSTTACNCVVTPVGDPATRSFRIDMSRCNGRDSETNLTSILDAARSHASSPGFSRDIVDGLITAFAVHAAGVNRVAVHYCLDDYLRATRAEETVLGASQLGHDDPVVLAFRAVCMSDVGAHIALRRLGAGVVVDRMTHPQRNGIPPIRKHINPHDPQPARTDAVGFVQLGPSRARQLDATIVKQTATSVTVENAVYQAMKLLEVSGVSFVAIGSALYDTKLYPECRRFNWVPIVVGDSRIFNADVFTFPIKHARDEASMLDHVLMASGEKNRYAYIPMTDCVTCTLSNLAHRANIGATDDSFDGAAEFTQRDVFTTGSHHEIVGAIIRARELACETARVYMM